MKPHYTMPFRSGEYVRQKVDPRHRGRVSAVFSGLTVKVTWEETGYISEHKHTELERDGGPR